MKIKGLTLTELMIAMAIAAIVTAMAIPTFSITMARSRIVTQTNEFLGYLNYVRNEAITRGRQVVLCKSDNATDCTINNSWEQGFIIFVDTNNDFALDADETTLRVRTQFENNLTITGSSTVVDNIAYSSDGRIRPTEDGKLSICDPVSGLRSAIEINKVGRARSDAECKNCKKASECTQCTAECPE